MLMRRTIFLLICFFQLVSNSTITETINLIMDVFCVQAHLKFRQEKHKKQLGAVFMYFRHLKYK